MRLFLAALIVLVSLPALAERAYRDDLYQERFLFGEKSTGRFVQSYYSRPMDTVRFGDCVFTTRCEWMSRDLRREDLRKLHNSLLTALENEYAERMQKRHSFTSFFSSEDDTAELALVIAELREDGFENWILIRPGNPFARNFRSKSLYTKIVKVMTAELNKPIPLHPVLEADSGH